MRTFVLAAFLACCSALPAQVVVLNGASFRAGQPVTGGSWAAAFGAFTGVTQTTATVSPIPKTLAGVTVSVNGVAAPVYFVSATQINFLAPLSVTPGLRAVEVKTASATFTGTVRVISAAPGLFVYEAAPVRRGQPVTIYATGPGALSAAVEDGAPAPSSPLVTTTSTPDVFIGGVKANVLFSGMAPGFAGLWQINAVVPDRPFLNGRMPLQIYIDGVDSNEASLLIQ